MAAAPAPSAAQDAKRDVSGVLEWLAVMLLAAYFVMRAAAYQLTPYTPEAALAGLLGLAAAACVWGASLRSAERGLWPGEQRLLVLGLWLGLILWGTFRSPNAGAAVPRAADWGLCALLLVSAHLLVRARPSRARDLSGILVALGAVTSLLAVWQQRVDLPRLRSQVQSGEVAIAGLLSGRQGMDRLRSEEIYSVFGNANSFAAFLLLTIFLQIGTWLDARRRRAAGAPRWGRMDIAHAALFALQAHALWISGSKGGWVAAAFGVWLLAGSYLLPRRPFRVLTALGVAAVLAILAAGAAGTLTGRLGASLDERFGYWRTGWNMLREHPVVGVGLAGFGDAYTSYKVPWAREVKEAHNDWLQFACELGLWAPLVWGLLWWILLRRTPMPTQGETPTGTVEGKTGGLSGGGACLAGALLGFFLVWAGGTGMNAEALREWMEGAPGAAGSAWGALLCLPIFCGAFLLRGGRDAGPPGEAWGRAARAGIGALLVHQLVDFDHTAQLVMAGLFVLGGTLAALEPSTEEERAWSRARVARVFMPVLLVALIPMAVAVPFLSGLQRRTAENIEDDFTELWAKCDNNQHNFFLARFELWSLRQGIAYAREWAYRWAPFDGQAAADAGLASSKLGSKHQVTLAYLMSACALRPRWSLAPLLEGHFLIEGGLSLLESAPAEAKDRFVEAEAEYRKACNLYPLAPHFHIMVGDALSLQGRTEEAAKAYQSAWATDRIIEDPNVYFGSILYDPVPGCLSWPDREDAVLKAMPLGESDGGGFALRRFLAQAWRAVRRPASDPAAAALRKSVKDAAEALARAWPEDGHAALMYAAAVSWAIGGKDEIAGAWAQALELQTRSMEKGTPDTPLVVFNELRRRLGP